MLGLEREGEKFSEGTALELALNCLAFSGGLLQRKLSVCRLTKLEAVRTSTSLIRSLVWCT